MPFTTVARRARFETVTKGSRFIAVVAPATSVADARALRDELRATHLGASHHCSAWRVGEAMAADDDGEPGGTAGRPMLEVLLKRDLDRVAAVCVRWFGGTKLGAGGLIRAYGGTVAKALDTAGTAVVHETAQVRIAVPFAQVSVLHRLLDDWPGLLKGEPSYGVDGVHLAVELRSDQLGQFRMRLADATAGEALVETDDPAA